MRLHISNLPLMSLALCFALASAAVAVAQEGAPREAGVPTHRVVASGRLTGTRELQQVVTWQTRGTAYLAVKSRGPRPRILWQTGGGNAGSRVDSVRVADLDGDGLPEVLSLWWKHSSLGAELNLVHWDRRQNAFVELQSEDEINRAISYRVVRTPGRSSIRIVVEMRSSGPGRSKTPSIEYMLRGSRLVRVGGVRVGGDPIVTTQGESGIEGQAVISPARPGPTREGIPNSAPYKTTLVVWSADGNREITRFETDSDGRFRVALEPGTYRVGPPPQTGRFLPRASEETVTVASGRFVRVTINFDSGMR